MGGGKICSNVMMEQSLIDSYTISLFSCVIGIMSV